MRFNSYAIAAMFLASSAVARAEACRSDSVVGLFEGTALSEDLGEIEITLNLFCDRSAYAAQLFTSIGDLDVSDAASKNGNVSLAFDTGASLGTFDLTATGTDLKGSFLVAGDTGAVALTRKGEPLATDGLKPHLDLTPAQWREDLDALRTGLPKRHANAFFYLPKVKFDAEISRLQGDVGSRNSDQIFVRMMQIVNAIGDGHTGIVTPDDRRVLPIELTSFGTEMRVTATGPGLERANGTRVVKIGGLDLARARELALTVTPTEELPELREGRIVYYLARGLMLHGLGITPTREHAVFTLRDDAGATFATDIEGSKPGEEPTLTPAYPKSGLRYQQPDEPFWCEDLATAKAVFCSFRAYQELERKAKAMFALIDATRPGKLVIDMRDNGGGDNTVGYAHLIKPLIARGDLNRKGKLFVLIGPLTFSAAMNNAAQFQDETNAILVGQTIGEKPNSYQEPRQFRLPNSHIVVRASTRYYEFRKGGANAVRPNKEIIPTWADMKAGRDAALDWALAQ